MTLHEIVVLEQPQPEAVSIREISQRLHVPLERVKRWMKHPRAFSSPFPPPRWRRCDPYHEFMWEWRVVAAWHEHMFTKVYLRRQSLTQR